MVGLFYIKINCKNETTMDLKICEKLHVQSFSIQIEICKNHLNYILKNSNILQKLNVPNILWENITNNFENNHIFKKFKLLWFLFFNLLCFVKWLHVLFVREIAKKNRKYEVTVYVYYVIDMSKWNSTNNVS